MQVREACSARATMGDWIIGRSGRRMQVSAVGVPMDEREGEVEGKRGGELE